MTLVHQWWYCTWNLLKPALTSYFLRKVSWVIGKQIISSRLYVRLKGTCSLAGRALLNTSKIPWKLLQNYFFTSKITSKITKNYKITSKIPWKHGRPHKMLSRATCFRPLIKKEICFLKTSCEFCVHKTHEPHNSVHVWLSKIFWLLNHTCLYLNVIFRLATTSWKWNRQPEAQ